jgi:hypothetical protein
MKTLCDIEGEISNWTNWHNFGRKIMSIWYIFQIQLLSAIYGDKKKIQLLLATYYWYDVINANKMIHNELVLLVCFSTVDDMNLLIWSNPIGDRNTGILVLCTILVWKIVPVLWFFFQFVLQYWYTSNVIKILDFL